MPSVSPYVLLALVAGACLPTQAGINAQLNLWVRAPVLASAISFAVGTLCLVLYTLILKTPMPSLSGVSTHPWWIWSGGLIGAFFVASALILAPRLGAASMLGLIVAGQMFTSLFLDHFGYLGYQAHPLNIWRIAGMISIIGGVVLIRVF